MASNSKLWDLEPHTIGKHLVLRKYLEAWLPIMSRWNGRVVFIDAFAGPGQYSGGEDGSPIIALKALIEHSYRQQMRTHFDYVFIEKDAQRHNHLKLMLMELQDRIPPNCTYNLVNSTFDEALTEELKRLEDQRKNLAPALVMIDPFGVSETPMKTISLILANAKAEVYISFMYSFMNRFIDHPNMEPHLDDLFGTDQWQMARRIEDSEARKQFLYGLYCGQLKLAGAKQVLHFEMYDGNRLVYAIFFGTKNLEGSDKMKEAIWKVVPTGDYRFRSGMDSQLHMGATLIDYGSLRRALHEEFKTKPKVDIETVTDFVKSDKTDFYSGQLRTHALRPMENEGILEVYFGAKRRKGTYPPGSLLTFRSNRPDETDVQHKMF